MKNLVPLLVVIILSSCAANKRGGYHRLPPLENRFGRQMYWKKERSHGQINPKKNTIAIYDIAEG